MPALTAVMKIADDADHETFQINDARYLSSVGFTEIPSFARHDADEGGPGSRRANTALDHQERRTVWKSVTRQTTATRPVALAVT